MEGFEDESGTGRADNVGQSVEIGFGDSLETLEAAKQGRARCFADPLDRVEAADGLPLRATVAVVGYAETVGLVAQMLDNAQGLGILVDICLLYTSDAADD